MHTRHAQRWKAWLALLVMSLSALAPGVSRALAADATPGSPFAPVCRVGRTDGPLRAGQDEPSQALAHALAHCAFCASTVLDSSAPPPAPLRLALLAPRAHAPDSAQAASAGAAACAPPPARAPPVRC